MTTRPRLAVRAILLHQDRLLLVNAWAGYRSDLWCAPGGGVVAGSSLHDNLIREVHEETGLTVHVGLPALVNEFHDPKGAFHQVEVFFRCQIVAGTLSDDWRDPEGVVNRRRWVAQDEVTRLRVKPDALVDLAWKQGFAYDSLEPISR